MICQLWPSKEPAGRPYTCSLYLFYFADVLALIMPFVPADLGLIVGSL